MMRQINLFNPALLPKKHQFSASTMLQATALVALSLAGVVWFGQLQLSVLQKQADANARQLGNLQAQLKTIQTQFAPRQKNPQLEVDLNKSEQHLHALQEMQTWLQNAALGNSYGYAAYMTALARQSESGLWLTGFDLQEAGQEIALRGRTIQPDLIATYVQRLGREAVFKGKSFDTLSVQRMKEESREAGPAASPASAPAPVATASPATPRAANALSATGAGAAPKAPPPATPSPIPAPTPVAAVAKAPAESRVLEFVLQGVSVAPANRDNRDNPAGARK